MLLRILLPLIVLLLLPAWGIDRLWLRRHVGKWGRRLFYAPNAVLLLLVIFSAAFESYSAAADHWKGLLLSIVILVVVSEVVAALLLLVALPFRKKKARTHKALAYFAWGMTAIVFCSLLYGMTGGYRHIVVKDYAYESRRLPKAFDGYRITQLSDLHLGTLHGHESVVERIVDSVNATRPDLIVFTGDLVNYHAEEVHEFEAVLRRLKAPDGVVAIMGNHDYAQYYKWDSPLDSLADIRHLQNRERAMGWSVLLNDNLVIHRGDDSIAIVGVENDGLPPFPQRGDLTKAQRGLTADCFKVLLSHDPTHWRRRVLPETNIDLMLAGHTHGMQFKIGGFSPASWFYREWGGDYTDGGRTLYVSLGVGEVLIPFRLGAWPEINVITLKRSQQ